MSGISVKPKTLRILFANHVPIFTDTFHSDGCNEKNK